MVCTFIFAFFPGLFWPTFEGVSPAYPPFPESLFGWPWERLDWLPFRDTWPRGLVGRLRAAKRSWRLPERIADLLRDPFSFPSQDSVLSYFCFAESMTVPGADLTVISIFWGDNSNFCTDCGALSFREKSMNLPAKTAMRLTMIGQNVGFSLGHLWYHGFSNLSDSIIPFIVIKTFPSKFGVVSRTLTNLSCDNC
jgi:hypothetical protein